MRVFLLCHRSEIRLCCSQSGQEPSDETQDHLQDESSCREGCREGEEGADGKRNSNCLQTPAPADGISSETPLSEGSRGREGTVRTDDVAPKRRKKKDRGNEHNSSFTCCYYFFFKLCISSVIMDRMCLYIHVCSGIGADTCRISPYQACLGHLPR